MLKLDTGRRSFEIRKPDGSTYRWEYDIVSVKLEIESFEKKHGIRTNKSDEVGATTEAFLKDLAAFLEDKGIGDCTTDAAFYVYSIVNTQFIAMQAHLQSQVDQILNER